MAIDGILQGQAQGEGAVSTVQIMVASSGQCKVSAALFLTGIYISIKSTLNYGHQVWYPDNRLVGDCGLRGASLEVAVVSHQTECHLHHSRTNAMINHDPLPPLR